MMTTDRRPAFTLIELLVVIAIIAVSLKVPAATPGELNRSVEVFTDCPNHQTIRFVAGCRVSK